MLGTRETKESNKTYLSGYPRSEHRTCRIQYMGAGYHTVILNDLPVKAEEEL
jgi:hypothetical protein